MAACENHPAIPRDTNNTKDSSAVVSNHISPPASIPTPVDTAVPDTSNRWMVDSSDVAIAFCQSARFGSTNLYAVSQLEQKSGNYATSNDYRGQPQVLNYQFLAPANDTLARRPFVLLVHEGAFLFGELRNEMDRARLLARKGYAVAAINYRLGFEGASQNNSCGGSSTGVIEALYRAVQDTRAALRYFADNREAFGLDPKQFFLAGSSSGSMTVTALNYMGQADFEQRAPGIVQRLGSLEGKGNRSADNYRIRALLTYMGFAILDEKMIQPTNAKPTLMFQGSQDNILPYGSGKLYGCYLTTYGSYPMAERMKQIGQPYEWIVRQDVGHVLDYTPEYIAETYAEFMKRIWCNDHRQISRVDKTADK